MATLLSELDTAAPPELRGLLDRQVYDARGLRVARVGDVVVGDGGVPAAVLIGPAAVARRLGLGFLAARLDDGRIAWSSLQAADGHPGALQIRDGEPAATVRRHRHRFPVMRRRRHAPA